MPEPVLVSIAAAVAGHATVGLYTLVAVEFADDPDAKAALEAAEGAAEDSPQVRELAAALETRQTADPAFGEQLRAEWKQVRVGQHAETGGVVDLFSGTVAGNAVQVGGRTHHARHDDASAKEPANHLRRPLITIVVDFGAPPAALPDRPIGYVRAIESGTVIVGDHNKVNYEAKFRIKRIEVTSATFWDRISKEAKDALAELRQDPTNSAANRRFRGALPNADLTVVPGRIDLSAEPGVPIDLEGNTGLFIHGHHHRVRSTSVHVIAKGQLPLHELLRDDRRLVTAFAKSFDSHDMRGMFTRKLDQAVKSCNITDIIRNNNFDGPTVSVTIRDLETNGVPVASIGRGTKINTTSSTTIGSVTKYRHKQVDDITEHLPPVPPIEPPPISRSPVPPPHDRPVPPPDPPTPSGPPDPSRTRRSRGIGLF